MEKLFDLRFVIGLFFTVVGLLGNEIAATALSGVTASGATATNAGTYSNSLSGSATNYNLTFVNGSLTISPATLTLTGTQAYNGTAVIYGAGLTAHGVNNESFTVSGSADLISKHVQTNQALANVNGLKAAGLPESAYASQLTILKQISEHKIGRAHV